jgi:hypothetical protein
MGNSVRSYEHIAENTYTRGAISIVAYGDDNSGSYACPRCGKGGLLRIRRRFIDRILSLFVRQRRFRCTHSGCQWEGNLREKKPGRKQAAASDRQPGRLNRTQ